MKLVIVRSDGKLSIAHMGSAAPTEEDVQIILNSWASSSESGVVSWKLVEDDALPDDRTNRDSWILEGDKVIVGS